MKKHVLFSFLCLCAMVPTIHSQEIVKSKDFEGVIFPESSEQARAYWAPNPRHSSWWTPSKKDILKAEKCLKSYLDNETAKRGSNKNARDLHNYRRQYFGFYENNQKRILLNLFTNWEWHKDWQTRPVQKAGGHRDFQAIYDFNNNRILRVYSTSAGNR